MNNDAEPELSILLVNWNTREMTLDCVRSVYAETKKTKFELIVLDNASSDGSVEAIRREFPDVVVMAESVNHGFSVGTNIQVFRARAPKILLLNTDTVVLDRAIDNLMDFSRREPQAKIWGGRTLFADRSLNPTSCYGRLAPWNQASQALGLTALFPNSPFFNPRAYPGWQRDSERQVDIVTGCLLMIEKAFWEELGGFNAGYFMYGDDTDLCARAIKRGARPMITPSATIIHYGGGSTRSHTRKICQISAAHIAIIKQHYPRGWRRFGAATIIANVLIRTAGYGLAAKLRPSRYADISANWSAAWARREEWMYGYPSRQGVQLAQAAASP